MYDHGRLLDNLPSEANNRPYIWFTAVFCSIVIPKLFVGMVVAVTHWPERALPPLAYIR